jgi:hypothetical protein
LREFATTGIAVPAVVGICALGWANPAFAYRPFDGTDAAVADLGEVEIEFQPIGAMRAGPTKPVSDAILNFGFAERWELVLQGTAQPLPEGVGPISVSNAAFLKYVLQPGVLQDKSGPSIATEFGPLLPAAGGGSGVGWPDRNSVAAMGLGNGSFECGIEPHARSTWQALFRCHHRGTEQMESPTSF